MEKYEINKYLTQFNNQLNDLKASLNPDLLEKEVEEITKKMNADDFWLDQKQANKTIDNLNKLKDKLQIYETAKNGLKEVNDAIEIAELEESDEANQLLETTILNFDKLIEDLMIKVILNGPYYG